MSEIFNYIKKELNDNKVVLFMKGSKEAPECGFSALVVQILEKLEVSFKDINVLKDNALRQGIKEFSNWPTIPQLYINGEFIGGSDIVKEMYLNGQLKEML